MFCTSCGKEMKHEDRFCPTCGVAAPAASSPGAVPPPPQHSRYTRPLVGRKIAGVCAGIARHNGWDVTMVRVAFLAGFVLHGVGLLAYCIAWIAMPNEQYYPYPAR